MEAIDCKHLGKPTGFGKSSASALWSDTVIGDEVLTPCARPSHAHTHMQSERAREGDRGENPFFPTSAPLSYTEYRGRTASVVTLWDSSCRPCQSRVHVEARGWAEVLLFPILLAKKRCAYAARLPAVVETPLGKWSRGSPWPIRRRVTFWDWHSSWWTCVAFTCPRISGC